MRRQWLAASIVFSTVLTHGYNIAMAATEYQIPSKQILQLADVKQAPYFIMDEGRNNALMLYRNNYKTIAELSEKELRLGGLRIDPKANIGSRTTFYNDVKVRRISDNNTVTITGLPNSPRLSNFVWSPDQAYMAMTHKTPNGVELWVLDVAQARAKKLTGAHINANMRDPVTWLADSKALLVKMVPKDKQSLIDTKAATPTGPTVSVSDGKKAQNRTYQDLLKNKNDEFNFEQLTRSELVVVPLEGKQKTWLSAAMFGKVNVSPSGEYVLVTEYHKPFSYLVQYNRFPSTITVYDKTGDKVKQIASIPLIEDLPKGFMAVREGARNIQWRNDPRQP